MSTSSSQEPQPTGDEHDNQQIDAKRKAIRVPLQQSKLVSVYRDKCKEVIDNVIARRFPQMHSEADIAHAAKKYRQALYHFYNAVTRRYKENVENVKLQNDSELYYRQKVVKETPEKVQLEQKNNVLMAELGKVLRLHHEHVAKAREDVRQTAALLIARKFEQEARKGPEHYRLQLTTHDGGADSADNSAKIVAFTDMCKFSDMRAREHLKDADKACDEMDVAQSRYRSLDAQIVAVN